MLKRKFPNKLNAIFAKMEIIIMLIILIIVIIAKKYFAKSVIMRIKIQLNVKVQKLMIKM